VLVYAATIFLSAFLLFQVQPLIAKFILPWFGGSAAVWSAALLFFQLLLLAGYLYAHCLIRYLKPQQQFWVHGSLLILSLATLPIVPSAMWKPSGGDDPTLRILLLLGATIGLPYGLLSATSPLLQACICGRTRARFRIAFSRSLISDRCSRCSAILWSSSLASRSPDKRWSGPSPTARSP